MIDLALTHRFPGLSLDVAFQAPGGVTALFGRSGAGKTTVVRAVAGLMRPQEGRITIGGKDVLDTQRGLWLPPHRRRIGYVFQDARLFPHMSVRQNLRYGAKRTGGVDISAEAQVTEMLGLGPLLQRRPGHLSGGEAQRVAIGRALLARPRLLLLDEPLSGLDAARKAEVLPYLERLRDTGLPMLYVSHDISEVARLANTVVMLDAGKATRIGPVATLLADPDAVPALGPRTAGALLQGTVAAQHEDGLTEVTVSGGQLFLPRVGDTPPGAPLRIRIAAQDVILATRRPQELSALNILHCTVTALRSGEGPGTMVQLQAGQDLLLARITDRSVRALGLAPGVKAYAVVKTVSVAKADITAPTEAEPRG